MHTELERVLAKLNCNIFWREYTFARNQFKSSSGQELELADHVVLLPGALLVFQAKERSDSADNSDTAIERWFNRKVLRKACSQLADTRDFFETEPNLSLPNQRGHARDLAGPDAPIIQVALYSCGGNQPALLSGTSHRQSSKAGFVHILHVRDYYEVCRILALPIEIVEYFNYREEFLLRNDSWKHHEARLLASYIAEEAAGELEDDAVRAILADALFDAESFDLGNMLVKFGEKAYYYEGGSAGTDYYAILNEFAHMNRVQMRGFRGLRDWALEKAGGQQLDLPARMLVPKRNTGFVVFPVPEHAFDERLTALSNYTLAAKYDWKLPRQVGVAISRVGEEILIDWEFASFPWMTDSEIDSVLTENYPFRPRPEPKLDYRFRIGF